MARPVVQWAITEVTPSRIVLSAVLAHRFEALLTVFKGEYRCFEDHSCRLDAVLYRIPGATRQRIPNSRNISSRDRPLPSSRTIMS